MKFYKPTSLINKHRLAITVLVTALSLGACSSNDDDSGTTSVTDPDISNEANTETNTDTENNADNDQMGSLDGPQQLAIFASDAFDRSAGQVDRISITDGYVGIGGYTPTMSDIRVKTDGTSVFELGRFLLDSLTRLNPTDTSTAVQFSVLDDAQVANPHDLAFASEDKAYVIRYGSSSMLIVNPNADVEEDFRTGELDLSAYDQTGAPDATSGVVVGNRLFILMQRLDGNFAATQQSYVAVFDTTTDTEIDTGKSNEEGLLGIALGTLNAENMRYNETLGQLVLTGRGDLFLSDGELEDPYQGGIQTIDPETFEVTTLLDDGTADSNQGFIGNSVVLDNMKGYVRLMRNFDPTTFIFGETSVHSFNALTGEVGDEITAVQGMDVSTMNIGSDGNLWLGVRSENPGFVLLNPADDSVVNPLLATTFSPLNVVFLTTQ